MKVRAKTILAQNGSVDFEELGERVGIDWNSVEFTPEDLAEGYDVELEHGTANPDTNVTDDDEEMTAKIAWVHLDEMKDYYKQLSKMEG